jgi:Zn-dependent M28 family amino/carboxypeptidase
MNPRFLLGLATLSLVSAGPSQPPDRYGPISAARLSQHVRILASDAFEGRGPGTAGETKTVAYLSAQFAKLGLQPGGTNGSWTQELSIERLLIDGPVAITLRDGRGATTLKQGGDDIVLGARQPGHVAVENAPLVFVGYGVHAPGWSNLKDADLKGKIVIVLPGEPDVGPFKGPGLTPYAMTRRKYAEFARRGAIGVLLVNVEGQSVSWPVNVNSTTVAQYSLAGASTDTASFPVSGFIREAAIAAFYRQAGMDFAGLIKKASDEDFRPVDLPGATLSVAMMVASTRLKTHNVLARLPGTRRPGETVLFMAHWDHLGRGRPDARGDTIYNGAIDNAAGVAGLLELARAFAQAPKTQRSVVFMATTGEELGMPGARYYVDHPVYPLEKTVAVLNMDTQNPNGPNRVIDIVGYGKTTMDTDQVVKAAARQGRTVGTEKEYGGSLYNRSDHVIFALKGVPPLFLSWGHDRIYPDRPNDDYINTRYHQPSDEWHPGMDFSGGAQNTELLYLVGRDLANSSVWPQWTVNGEYKDAREASAAARK